MSHKSKVAKKKSQRFLDKAVYESWKKHCHDKEFLEKIDKEIEEAGSPKEYLAQMDKIIKKELEDAKHSRGV